MHGRGLEEGERSAPVGSLPSFHSGRRSSMLSLSEAQSCRKAWLLGMLGMLSISLDACGLTRPASGPCGVHCPGGKLSAGPKSQARNQAMRIGKKPEATIQILQKLESTSEWKSYIYGPKPTRILHSFLLHSSLLFALLWAVLRRGCAEASTPSTTSWTSP